MRSRRSIASDRYYGEISEVRWKTGEIPPGPLSRISVFDAKAAALYADQQNRIEFLPHGLDLMRRLGEVYDTLGAAVDGERAKVEAALAVPLSAVISGTRAAVLVGRLTKATLPQDLPTSEEIEAGCIWSVDDDSTLAATEMQLGTDASALASKCKLLGLTMERVAAELASAVAHLDDAAVATHRKLHDDAGTAREAATLSGKELSGAVPLQGFGSEAWRTMFKYAKEYSLFAYPERPFPVTTDGAKCVLCQQPLSPPAAERLQSFDDFVKGVAEARAAKCELDCDESKSKIERLSIQSPEDVRTLLSGLNEDPVTASVSERVANFVSALASRRTAVTAAFGTGGWTDIPGLPVSPMSDLAHGRSHVAAEEAKHEANQDAKVRKALEARRDELRARRALGDNLAGLKKRRADLDTLSRMTACRAACNTSVISRQSSALRKKYVTKEFEERLFAEIEALDLSHLRFKVQEKTDHGASFIGVGLETAVKVRNHDILSDGEFRALAMACFLTEVHSIAGHSGIIVDDPVSSLDHLRTRIVAERLVKEAAIRQVIVFTHDLVFYNELYEAAAERGVPVVRHWIRRSEEMGFGTIFQDEDPWQAKPVRQRLDGLNKKLAQIKKSSASGETLRATVKDFYTDLRETWERLVEELLFNKTVTRFQLGVKTQSINGVEVTDDDYKRVHFAMKRASTHAGHDRAQAVQAALPRAEDMQKDIEGLKDFADELVNRKAKVEKRRRELERPETGRTA